MKHQFSSMAFLTVDPLIQSIYRDPFTVEMVDGILPRGKFLCFMQQDSLRLVDFARSLAQVAAKLREPDSITLALYFAEQALLAERELHEYYFKRYQVTPAEHKQPGCYSYTAHLLQHASLSPPAEAMAALLPGFWVSLTVGTHMRKLADADNPYFKWIDRYSGELFGVITERAVDFTDRLSAEAGDEECNRMMLAFVASCRYECSLRDDAYHARNWPVL